MADFVLSFDLTYPQKSLLFVLILVARLYVSGSGSITSVGEERELICLLSFACNYVVSVLRGFLILWVLGMGCVLLLWHFLSLPYNCFGDTYRELR